MDKKMRAAIYSGFGSADKISIETIDIPEVGEGEVLVKIKAAGVNPVDSAVREGYLKSKLPVQFPAVPGWDVAGVVEERGHAARKFDAGDEVYGYARRPVVQFGTFAEYIVLPESYLALKPRNLSFPEAAGIPLVGLTAYQSLVDAGKLQSGQTVLILGASGGVGTMAIQIAKYFGGNVIAVASQENHAYMKELGATETVDYRDPEYEELLNRAAPGGVDLIFDAASGDTLMRSIPSLKKEGKLVSILNDGKHLPAEINFEYVFVEPNSNQLSILASMAEKGKLVVNISDWFSLNRTADAMRQIETHHTRGKIVIVP